MAKPIPFDEAIFLPKASFFIVMLMLFILAGSMSAYAIGVSPARKVIVFEPGLKTEITQNVINNDRHDMKAVVYARGELEKYIKIKDSLLEITSSEDTKPFTFEINLPESIGKPGLHGTEIVVMELPKQFASGSSETSIGVIGSVVSEFYVRVPFPAKYAEAKLVVETNAVKQPVRFVVLVNNYGTQKIVKAKGVVDILGATYEKLGSIPLSESGLDPAQQAQLIGEWFIEGLNPGVYHAKAAIDYDGQQITLEENFKLGDLSVEVVDLKADKFQLGSIAAIDIFLENRWNSPIGGIYGILRATDKDGTEYAKVTTAPVSLEPLARGRITAYWDTRDIPIGFYDLNVEIHYEGKVTQRLIRANVNIDSIRTDFTPIGQAIVGPATKSRDAFLFLLIIVLAGVNLGWFFYFRKQKKKKK